MDNAHPSISASTNNFLTVPDALSNEAQALLLNTERYPHRHHVARTKQPKPSVFTTPHLHIWTMMLIILSLGNMCTALDVKALSEKVWSVAEVEGAFTAKISTRDEGGPAPICLYMTTEPDWKGEGMNVCAVGGFCASGFGDGLTGNVSSAGPEDGVMCRLYGGDDCQGDVSAPIVYPGYSYLSQVSFEKKARSFRCWNLCGYVPAITSTASSVDHADTGTALVSATSTSTALSETAGGAAGTMTAFSPPAPAKHHKRDIGQHQNRIAPHVGIGHSTTVETYFYELTDSVKCGPYPTCSAKPQVNCANIVATTAIHPGHCPKSVSAPQQQPADKLGGEVLVSTVLVETVAGNGGMVVETTRPALVWTAV